MEGGLEVKARRRTGGEGRGGGGRRTIGKRTRPRGTSEEGTKVEKRNFLREQLSIHCDHFIHGYQKFMLKLLQNSVVC